MLSDRYMRCAWLRCMRSDCSRVYESCPRLLKVLRESWTYGMWKWSTNFFDFWFWAEWQSEVSDVEFVTAESTYLVRVRKNRRHCPKVTGCLTFVRPFDVEQFVVDLDILEVVLAEESELGDPEETLRYCKLALSSEIVADSELPAAECSTSTNELDGVMFHRSDNRPCLFHFCHGGPSDCLDSDSNSDFDSMTKWTSDLCLLTWSFLCLLTYLSDSGNCLKILLILFLVVVLLIILFLVVVLLSFDLDLCPLLTKLTSSFLSELLNW